jgi:phenylacetate-CoA ligase
VDDQQFEISLVAPCLNEQDNVEILAQRFFVASDRQQIRTQIVFVDDGSTDLTWERIQQAAENWSGRVVAVRHATNQGIPRAWISGVESCDGRLVCLIDSDLQNPPESVFELHKTLVEHNVELVRGVRQAMKSQPYSRIIMSKALNLVLNVVFGMHSKDNKSGFVLGTHDAVSRIVRHSGHYRHYQTFIGVSAHSRGVVTHEVVTPFEDRRHGISFLSGRSFRVIREVFGDIPEAVGEFGSRFRDRGNR